MKRRRLSSNKGMLKFRPDTSKEQVKKTAARSPEKGHLRGPRDEMEVKRWKAEEVEKRRDMKHSKIAAALGRSRLDGAVPPLGPPQMPRTRRGSVLPLLL